MSTKQVRTPSAAITFLIICIGLQIWSFIKILLSGFVNSYIFIPTAINLFICYALFTKRRNNILVIAVGCRALNDLYSLISSIGIISLLYFLSSSVLLVTTIALCNQTFVKVDLTNIRKIIKKFFFLPALLAFVGAICFWVRMTHIDEYSYRIPSIWTIASDIFECLFLLSLAKWLVEPFVKQIPQQRAEDGTTYSTDASDEAYCSLGKHIVLCLFTFGIWYLIWTYRTTKYLNKTPNAVYYNPTSKLLLCMFVPFYSIYWFYKHGQRIDSFSKAKGLNHSDMAPLCLILGIFIPIVACIIMQDKINTLCIAKAMPKEQRAESQTADELKRYKELLDSGVITQEEFDAKKKQLLGL